MIERYYTVAQVAGMFSTTQQVILDNFNLIKFGNQYRISQTEIDRRVDEQRRIQ